MENLLNNTATTVTLKTIPGFSNYKVDSMGNVYSYMNNPNGKLLKLSLTKGYLRTRLKNDSGEWFNMSGHKLVMLAFYGYEYSNKKNLVIDHINNDKTDNRLVNLQIISQRLNSIKDKRRELPTGVTYDKKTKNYQVNFYDRAIGLVKLGRVTNINLASEMYKAAVELKDKYIDNKQFRIIVMDLAIINLNK